MLFLQEKQLHALYLMEGLTVNYKCEGIVIDFFSPSGHMTQYCRMKK